MDSVPSDNSENIKAITVKVQGWRVGPEVFPLRSATENDKLYDVRTTS